MYGFDNRFIEGIDVRDRYGDVVLNGISNQNTYLQMLFSMLEMQEVFRVYSNVFTPGSNYIT